jgi:eukaryotic-like serine/threonine-protein kinase
MTDPIDQGELIDGFRLEELMHQSALGTLWRVSRPDIDVPIIMKLPLLRAGSDPLAIIGYETEQMILQQLSGTHVPRFVAAGDFHGPYVVMERIAGRSLMDRLTQLPLTPADVAKLGAGIADALEDLHRQKVIHLDLKPSNIMIRDSGEVVLLDYGLSRHLDLPDLPAEELDGPIGTGTYIAPEQVLGIRHDPRSDLFALGVLLYFFSTGERPFGEPRTVGQWHRRLYSAPDPPRRRRSEIPPWLQEIILHCLEVDPGDRYQRAAHVAFDLRHPDLIPLTERAKRTRGSGALSTVRRWTNQARRRIALLPKPHAATQSASIIMAAVDLDERYKPLSDALIKAVGRIMTSEPNARLACVNVMKLSRVKLDQYEDEEGRNLHLLRLAELKHWAAPLQNLPIPNLITYHVIEAPDSASALIEFARHNNVDHVAMGARKASVLRRYLGSVSAKVVAEVPCSVTIVRAAAILDHGRANSPVYAQQFEDKSSSTPFANIKKEK